MTVRTSIICGLLVVIGVSTLLAGYCYATNTPFITPTNCWFMAFQIIPGAIFGTMASPDFLRSVPIEPIERLQWE